LGVVGGLAEDEADGWVFVRELHLFVQGGAAPSFPGPAWERSAGLAPPASGKAEP
jgi:hypothetical protein